jgi:RNA polymerase sigma-70 factor (ECF subfamily)
MARFDVSFEPLLIRARAGDEEALGELLDLYRNYLRVLARSLIGGALRIRLDPSDLVQETYLKAHREFGRFLGSGEPELVVWLRQILVHNLADQAKYHRSQGRDVRREEPLAALLDRPSLDVQGALAAPISSPVDRAAGREQAVLLVDALARIPADYREVFVLRHLEHVPIDQIAERMGRSPNAVRKLWTRALLALRQELELPG